MIPKVSVIIPVYNAQKHIERCCHALFSQTLKDLEIIFVNDCSSDKSVGIIQEILSQYPDRVATTFIINHERNKGVGAARKSGNAFATGKYIIHCDSDDIPRKDMYSQMYDTAEAENADIVICDYYCGNNTISLIGSDIHNPAFDISPINGAVWNKLICRKLLAEMNITFCEDLILGEDFLYITQARLLAKKTVHLPVPLYNYTVDNTESITRHYNVQKCESLINVAIRMEHFLEANYLLSHYTIALNYLKFQAKSFYLMFPETRDLNKYKQLFPECESHINYYPVSLYRKISSFLIYKGFASLCSSILRIKDLKNF